MDIHPGARIEKRKQAGPAIYDFVDGNRTVTWTASSLHQPEITSAVSFRLADQRFLLVKWNSEFCGSVYNLFEVGAVLKPIAGNHYDCDQ